MRLIDFSGEDRLVAMAKLDEREEENGGERGDETPPADEGWQLTVN